MLKCKETNFMIKQNNDMQAMFAEEYGLNSGMINCLNDEVRDFILSFSFRFT